MLKVAWDEIYALPLPEGHRFPMLKYELLPQQLLLEGTIKPENIFSPSCLSIDKILSTHTSDYWNKLNTGFLSRKEVRAIGFPYSSQLVTRERVINQGTIDCCDFALKFGAAMNIAGGTHHAFTDRGEGFCLLNDQAIAANYLLNSGLATKILIVDLDVHQGNGTAQIFNNNTNVYTFSMHGSNNYPLKKEISTRDVGLNNGIGDREYLEKLVKNINEIFDLFQPNFIFYQSGVDVLESDKLGKLCLTLDGCKKRDEIVIKLAKQAKIPLVVCMGGGYSPEIKTIIEAHANTFRTVVDNYY
jgi:acetoin utilization deacetylase AcuC-like enzyme